MHEIVVFNDDQDALCWVVQAILIQQGDTVLAAQNVRDAVALATARQVDAVILNSSIGDISSFEAAARIKQFRPETPILLFSGAEHPLPSTFWHFDAFVDKSEGVGALLSTLRRMLSPIGGQKPPVRRFARFRLELPFFVAADRSGEVIIMRGTTLSIGEGGLGGQVDDRLVPGELVLLQVPDSLQQVFSEPRAQVRYCNGDVYGFEFLDITPIQQSEVRRLCERLLSA